MRKILFRGTSEWLDNWVYGSLVLDEDLDFVCILPQDIEENNTEELEDYDYPYISKSGTIDGQLIRVDKNTIGQYTGLTDKNGIKIFEGDIVEFETNVNCLTNELKPYWKDCIEKQYVIGGGTWWVRKDQAVVQWNSKDGMWDLKVYNNGRYKRKSKLFTYRESDYVVIGNIYDNPKLLEN